MGGALSADPWPPRSRHSPWAGAAPSLAPFLGFHFSALQAARGDSLWPPPPPPTSCTSFLVTAEWLLRKVPPVHLLSSPPLGADLSSQICLGDS